MFLEREGRERDRRERKLGLIERNREKQSLSGELWSYWNNPAQKQSFNFSVKCHSYNSLFHDYCQLTLQSRACANGKLKWIDSPNTMFWYLNYLSHYIAWAKPKVYIQRGWNQLAAWNYVEYIIKNILAITFKNQTHFVRTYWVLTNKWTKLFFWMQDVQQLRFLLIAARKM